jgi:RNA polymerase sigma factor (sigma-70 family)
MTQSDSDLLRAFVADHSETAFSELVGRHIDLVYSAALRQLNGDAHFAEDVTQDVFESLSRKATRLTRHTSLAGWLYLNTRFAASNLRRSEHRRFVREQEAYSMNKILQADESSPDWEQLRPVIDDTMCELDEEDREAVLLKFFQKCSLAEIGARLGIKENTARMRIERALDKLRAALAKRGITSAAAAVAASLASHAVSAAPAGMAVKICRAVMTGTGVATGGGVLATLFGGAMVKLALAAFVVAAVGLPLIHHLQIVHNGNAAQLHSSSIAAVSNNSLPADHLSENPKSQSNQALNSIAVTGPKLELYLDDPKTGKPVPNVAIDDRCWSKNGNKESQFHADKNGWCVVTYPSNVTELELTTILDGYADTRLDWHADRGDKIPLSYTVHLDKAVPIGGQVVDENGMPIAGAKVGWNHEDDPLAKTFPESHDFGWIEATTDAEGHWQIDRIAGDMIHRIYGSARDADYVDSSLVFAGRDPSAEKALREGTYIFKLGFGAIIEGSVSDSDGNPVPDAKVFTGYISSSDQRKTTTDAGGSFILSGCKLGDSLLTAAAPGFANTTKEINITTNNSKPFQIVLTKGKILKLRVQNQDGTPIPNASVWLDTINQDPMNSPYFNVKRAQVDFSQKSDANGEIIWSNAPDGELKFEFSAPGYMRSGDFYFTADGKEHIVTLNPALTIFGTVRDADSGELIPHFRMGIGWPEKNYATGQTNGHWSPIERFWPEFSGGQYSNSLEEAALGGTPNPGYVLKFEADGYDSYISSVIAPGEGQVHLDVSLQRANSSAITVIDSNGQPAADADVGLVSPGAGLRLLPGGFSHNESGASLLRTDDAGHFTLPSDDSISRVIVACPAGYAEATPADLQKSPTIILQPWGRIEATCLSGGQPVAGREYLFELSDSNDNNPNTISAAFDAFHVTSDEQGKFVMPMVPPGKHRLIRLIPQTIGQNQNSWMWGNGTGVDIQPGAITTVTLGDKGYTVTANLLWPGGAPPTNLMNVMVALRTPMPPLPPEIVGHQDLIRQYYHSPEFQAIAKTAHNYPMAMNPDGTLEADDVPPGNYKLSAFAILQSQDGKPAGSISAPEISITVPSDPSTGQIDAGTIEMQQMPEH